MNPSGPGMELLTGAFARCSHPRRNMDMTKYVITLVQS